MNNGMPAARQENPLLEETWTLPNAEQGTWKEPQGCEVIKTSSVR